MATAMKSHKLRAYQRTAIESARRALTKSGSCILQMPTGAGKTRAATEIVATSRGVIWFVCHRQEIERQVAKAFTAAGIDFGVVSPRGEFQPEKRVQIISVHTNKKHIKKLPVPKLVIWDECHHAPAQTWNDIRRMAKGARHLGLTATPERLDGKGLREWFAELVTGPGISELIKRGYLSEFRYFAPSDPDLTNAKLQAGDYKKADLGKIMNTPVLIGDAVREYKKHAKGKRALAFCASKEAARDLAAKFNAERIPAKHVHDKTPAKERDSAVQDLAAGRVKVLCNVEVFTEGFDLPAIDAVILMRPTKSPTLLLQMIGRGLRKAKGKDVAIIMDHAGLHRDHAWFADDWRWSLEGGAAKARRAAMTRGPRRCPECKEVRAERVEVCACGYEFPTGREIGEFDGVLTEVRGAAPEGCVTRQEFARMMKVGIGQTVPRWIKRGMPTFGKYIPVAEATNWVQNNTRLRHGYVTQTEFAKRHNVAKTSPGNWIQRGMPNKNGLIDVTLGDEWVKENIRKCPIGWETITEFAKRHSVTTAAARAWAKNGLPCENAFVPRDIGDAWVSKNVDIVALKQRQKQRMPAIQGMEKQNQFAKRYGVTPSAVNRWVKMGMPTKGGLITARRADEWVSKNIDLKSATVRSQRSKAHDGFLSLKAFSRRHGKKSSMQSWVKCGLPIEERGVPVSLGDAWVKSHLSTNQRAAASIPIDENGFASQTEFARILGRNRRAVEYLIIKGLPISNIRRVHIQRGLEWVRDNTNIKIPASAWPKKAAKSKRSHIAEEHRASA